jgi:molybdate transport system ATP-binding protein
MIGSRHAVQSEQFAPSSESGFSVAGDNARKAGVLSVAVRRALPGFTLDVAFDAPAGLTVLFGPSGAGKSLTLQAIAGLLPLDAAHIALDGVVWHDSARGVYLPPQRRHVGYVPQHYALFPHLTVEQNIAFGLKTRGSQKKESWQRIGELIALMRLGGLERQRPAQLSGGQQQRVALARALAVEPRLMLLDEPFSSLDAAVREALREELRALHERVHVPIVLVTHDAAEARMLAETVVVIQHGRVLQVGVPDAVFRSPVTRAVAALVGMHTCWTGVVIGFADGRSAQTGIARVQVDHDLLLDVCVPARMQVHSGQTLQLGIRTDELRVYSSNASRSVDKAEQSMTLVPGTVLRDQPKGVFHCVTVQLQTRQVLEIPMIAREVRDLGIEADSRVVVEIPLEAVHVFPSL